VPQSAVFARNGGRFAEFRPSVHSGGTLFHTVRSVSRKLANLVLSLLARAETDPAPVPTPSRFRQRPGQLPSRIYRRTRTSHPRRSVSSRSDRPIKNNLNVSVSIFRHVIEKIDQSEFEGFEYVNPLLMSLEDCV
jgi:hypothetical protein